MAIVTGDRYLDALVKFVEVQSSALLDGTLVLKLNPVGLHYLQSRIEQLQELESLLAGAPVDYLRAYISDLGDHRALEQLRRILRLLTSLKVVSVLPTPARDPTPISLLPFGRLKVLELRGCDLSTSAARGLLELRHTLEKLICHNSTDALRHVFASRIMDIKESPTWNKLTFVSCACNGLVLMDESLQLLPSVETLDLSRNRFAKVDNLRRCTKLRHLDLGFNHLRTVASLSEVSYNIVKLILRNNALTTLHGIENLKSIEGLDLSYNIISNFSELEFLGSLVSLKNLWLEGNPICCARWYRAQVFSYFSHPQELTLDERGIGTRETWKRQIILASRQKQPAGYGFYSPAEMESEQGSTNTRRKISRLAFIEEDEQRSFFGSETADQESVSCDSGYMRRDENSVSDGEAEIASLMNKIELMKKERSVLWLREFKEWMDHNSGDRAEDSKFSGLQLINEKYRKSRKGDKHLGENSSYASDLVQDSGDESSTNFLESDTSFSDNNIGFSVRNYVESSSKAILESPVMDGITEVKPYIQQERMDSGHEKLKATQEELSLLPFSHMLIVQGGDGMERKVSMTSLTAIDEIMEPRSSSVHPGSPPHYQEDILHRRHNWEEEFLQYSAESFSLASSDSDTSCDDDSCKLCTSFPGADQASNRESMNDIGNDRLALSSVEGDNCLDEPDTRENGKSMLHCHAEPSSTIEASKEDVITPVFMDGYVNDISGSVINGIHSQGVDCMERKRGKRKPRKRIISLSGENLVQHNVELPTQAINVVLESDEVNRDESLKKWSSHNNDFQNFLDKNEKEALTDEAKNSHMHCISDSDMATCSASPTMETDEIVKNYFDENVADSGVSETCLQFIRCHCMLHQDSGYIEQEVALLRSSERKLYVLLVNASLDGRGNISKVLGCHRLEDIKEIVVGIGLQVLRCNIEGSISYLFITRNIEKSRGLLSLLQVCDSSETSSRCSIKSWEQVQIRLFEDSICGGVKMSIFQYSMLLFWHNHRDGESWLSRSLFVIAEHLLVCSEDILQFCSGVDDLVLSSPYFSLDSCCPICSISEMVIESRENRCLTMSLDGSESGKVYFLSENDKKKQLGQPTSSPLTWKLKWFSEDAIFKFVALIKAIHLATAMSSLSIRCIS